MIKEGCFVSRSVNGFQPGHVLTHQMLKASYDFPRELANIIYSEYDNCVISGLEYFVDKDEVFLYQPTEIKKYCADLWVKVKAD